MVVAELDVVGVSVHELEADPPLVVDRDGVLPRPITLEGVEAIAWRHTQVRQLSGDMHCFEFVQAPPAGRTGLLMVFRGSSGARFPARMKLPS